MCFFGPSDNLCQSTEESVGMGNDEKTNTINFG